MFATRAKIAVTYPLQGLTALIAVECARDAAGELRDASWGWFAFHLVFAVLNINAAYTYFGVRRTLREARRLGL